MWWADVGLLLQWPYLPYTLKKKCFQWASPLLHAMETALSARTNTVQPNDHSLENTTIKNSAPVSSLWSPGTAWPKNSNQNSFLPIHFDWKADAQLLVWELSDFSALLVNDKSKNSQMTIWVKWPKPWAPLDSLALGEEKIFTLLWPDSTRVSLGGTPEKCQSLLKCSFHPAAAFAARWWKHKLGGAGVRGNVLVSGESHTKPATQLHVTTAFVVPCLQAETTGDAEQIKRAESCSARWLCMEKAWPGRSSRNWYVTLKQELLPGLSGAGLSPAQCLSFPVGTVLAEVAAQLE